MLFIIIIKKKEENLIIFFPIDINECISGSDLENVCPADTTICVNLIGSYRCDCAPGYIKDNTSVNTTKLKIFENKFLFSSRQLMLV